VEFPSPSKGKKNIVLVERGHIHDQFSILVWNFFFLVADTPFFPFFLAASTPFSLLPHCAASGGSIVLVERGHTHDQFSIL